MDDPFAPARIAIEQFQGVLSTRLADLVTTFTRTWVDRTPMLELLREGLTELIEQIATEHAGTEATTNFHKIPSASIERYSAILSAWRSWASVWQIEILPREFQFGTSLNHSQIDGNETESLIVYRPDAERGSVFRIRAFGWTLLKDVREKAQVTISAGFAPADLSELESIARAQPAALAARVLARLRGFREASLAGNLEPIAVQLYIDFVDRESLEWDPTVARAFTDHLLMLLHEEFGLTPFYPTSYHHHPDGWVRIPEGIWMQTGRVTRVIRPGLVDSAGQLRIPARVEVE